MNGVHFDGCMHFSNDVLVCEKGREGWALVLAALWPIFGEDETAHEPYEAATSLPCYLPSSHALRKSGGWCLSACMMQEGKMSYERTVAEVSMLGRVQFGSSTTE